MDKRGFEFLQHTKNQFKNHWSLFINEKMTWDQLELITFAWIVQHEDLYRDRPLATVPVQNPKTSDADFKEVMKAWHLNCGSMEAGNKSNEYWLKRAKNFFLHNNYEEGIELYKRYSI